MFVTLFLKNKNRVTIHKSKRHLIPQNSVSAKKQQFCKFVKNIQLFSCRRGNVEINNKIREMTKDINIDLTKQKKNKQIK